VLTMVVCPNCGAEVEERGCKLICPRCFTIVETCSDA